MSDTFANPQPPSNYKHPAPKDDSGHLTNDDFRKLLMTPAPGSASAAVLGGSSIRSHKISQSVRSNQVNFQQKKKMDEKRKERKQFYAALVNESKEKQAELAQKYRDRAKERREKEKTGSIEDDVTITTSTNYRAVGPDFNLSNQAERRRQLIEESKYLGGDIEHTHLVKGLDYALLQKVKSQKEYGMGEGEGDDEDDEDRGKAMGPQRRRDDDNDDDEDDENDNEDVDDYDDAMKAKTSNETSERTAGVDTAIELAEQKIKMNLKPKILPKTASAALAAALNKSVTENPFAFKKYLETAKASKIQPSTSVPSKSRTSDVESSGDETTGVGTDKKVVFKSALGRSIYRQLFELELPKTNELFQPNRMAYIVDLNDEETDVPITSIRSKADCPNMDTSSIMTTNDIVINKLVQILSYLRHGKRDARKLKKKGILKPDEPEIKRPIDAASSSLSIYDDIGDYVPNLSKPESKTKKEDSEAKKKNYFNEKDHSKEEPLVQAPSKEAAQEFIKSINQKYADKEIGEEGDKKKKDDNKNKSGFAIKFDSDSYAECYPGTRAEEDVNIDSDEEADFSKMDLGNKKGPVNRWDFDTNEEYSDYMSNREALPKAAFQYGVKMGDGRKTKRMAPENKTEKARIDKEWTQISRIIDKRKNGEYSNSDMKKLKY